MGPGAVIGNVQNPAGGSSFDEQWLSEAAMIFSQAGRKFVLTGPSQRSPVSNIVYAINAR